MPSLKDNTKIAGDTHLAEIESDLPIEEGSPIGLGTRGVCKAASSAMPSRRPG